MNTTDTTSDKMTPNYLEEWKQARSVLHVARNPDRQHRIKGAGA